MKGRKLGSTDLSIDQMNTIVELTDKGTSRPDIAKKVGCCNMTVYNYQKKLIS